MVVWIATTSEIGRKSLSWRICCGWSLSYRVKSGAERPLMNRPCGSVTEVGATTRRTGTRNCASIGCATKSSKTTKRSHECERGTQECVRHRSLRRGQQDTEGRASEFAGDQ